MKISVCGKGGSGKTTITALIAKQALQRNFSVLVIDADDSNTGLYKMLGFDSPPTPLMSLAGGRTGIKEKMGQGNLLSKETIQITDIPTAYIRKDNGIMLVSIGKILQAMEGCACPMGVLNREFLKKLHLDEGQLAIVDMEAGVEHFGRGIDEFIDQVLIIVEPSLDSLNTAEKINDLASGMNKRTAAVLNKSPSQKVSREMKNALELKNITIIGDLPNDPLIFEAGLHGNIADRGNAFNAAGEVLSVLLQRMGK